jgi:hypothetical protein
MLIVIIMGLLYELQVPNLFQTYNAFSRHFIEPTLRKPGKPLFNTKTFDYKSIDSMAQTFNYLTIVSNVFLTTEPMPDVLFPGLPGSISGRKNNTASRANILQGYNSIEGITYKFNVISKLPGSCKPFEKVINITN